MLITFKKKVYPLLHRLQLLKRKFVFKTFKRKQTKFFVIGMNKTGTTTLKRTFEIHGTHVGDQRMAEFLTKKVIKNDLSELIEYCKTAQAFQDSPFSFPGIFKEIFKAFPNAKFILSVRDNEEQWFKSHQNFHNKRLGTNHTIHDLKNSNYVYKGWSYEVFLFIYGNSNELYNYERDTQIYLDHINEVKAFFKNNPHQLLVINVSKTDDYFRFCKFIGSKPKMKTFPHLNKTLS